MSPPGMGKPRRFRQPPAKAHCAEAMTWLRHRGWDIAPLTGQDEPCLKAIAHCWALYFRSDAAGRNAALGAVASLVLGCQPVCWPMARELIAQAGDWSHREPMWGRMADHMGDWVKPAIVHQIRHCHEGHPKVAGRFG